MLIFRYGTMAAGKSLHLLAFAHNLQEENISFIVLKSKIDDRDGENTVHSRAIPGGRPCISVAKEDNLITVVENCSDIKSLKYILVDEVQFLTIEQIEQLASIVDRYDIDIYCYGLKTDFKTKLFPASQRLFEIGDVFEEIKSYSFYKEKNEILESMFNARLDKDGKIVVNGKQIEVGGDDRYKAISRKEYFEKTQNKFYGKINSNY